MESASFWFGIATGLFLGSTFGVFVMALMRMAAGDEV